MEIFIGLKVSRIYVYVLREYAEERITRASGIRRGKRRKFRAIATANSRRI